MSQPRPSVPSSVTPTGPVAFATSTPRCKRSVCRGSECKAWRQCEPHTPCGGYRSQLAGSLAPLAPSFVVLSPAAISA